jgi:hypothetical protein
VVCSGVHRRCAYLVFIVGVQVQTALLGALPVCGNAVVDICLVDDLGNQLGAVGDGARVGGWEFAAQNGILATGGDEQAEQGPNAVDGKAKHNDGDEDEDGDASSHGGRWWWWAVSCLGRLLFPRRAGLTRGAGLGAVGRRVGVAEARFKRAHQDEREEEIKKKESRIKNRRRKNKSGAGAVEGRHGQCWWLCTGELG